MFNFGKNFVSALLSVISIILVISATSFSIYNSIVLKDTTTVQGEIADLKKIDFSIPLVQSEYGIKYYPVVTYEVGGIEYKINSPIGYNSGKFAIKDKVEVIYSNRKHNFAFINDFYSIWGRPIVFGILAVIFTIVNIAFSYYINNLVKQKTSIAASEKAKEEFKNFNK